MYTETFDLVCLSTVDCLESKCLSDSVSVTRCPCFLKTNCLRAHMVILEVWPSWLFNSNCVTDISDLAFGDWMADFAKLGFLSFFRRHIQNG